MSSPTGVPDDEYWQRPDPAAASPPGSPPPDRAPRYAGPPRAEPPPPHWRPPTVPQPPPPRRMPAQDLDAVTESERSARTVTLGVGMVAGAIALILMCLLCARALF